MVGQKTIVPDLSWPNGTVMEYDSDQEHQSPATRARDERKRRAYRAEGMDCLTLTNGILRSNHELNLFCEELEKPRPASDACERAHAREAPGAEAEAVWAGDRVGSASGAFA